MHVRTLCTIAFLALGVMSHAQNMWQPGNGPYGGSIDALAENTSNGYLFAAAYPRGIFRSTDHGATWELKVYGLGHPYCRTVYVDGNQTIIVGKYYNGVTRSTDDGESWSQTNLTNKAVYAFCGGATGELFMGAADGVYRSTDDGENFSVLGLNGTEVRALASKTGYLFAGTRTTGFYYSTDAGMTWTQSNTGLTSTNVTDVTVQPGSGDLFLVSNKVYRSTDDGANWSAALTFSVPYRTVFTNSGSILVGTASGIRRSTDDGTSWHAANNGLTAGKIHHLLVSSSGDIFAATVNGIFISTDDGVNWVSSNGGLVNTIVNALITAPNGDLYTGLYASGVYRSQDNGMTWQQVSYPVFQEGMQAMTSPPNGYVYAATSSGIYRSTDDGSAWSNVLIGMNIQSLASNEQGHVFATSFDHGIYRSLDDGATWTNQKNGLVDSSFSTTDVHRASGTVYIGSVKKGIYRSTDNGNNWVLLNTGFPDTTVSALAVNQETGYVYAAFSNAKGMYRSTDNGTTWEDISGSIATKEIHSIAFYGGDRIFAGSNSFPPVYQSTNGGTDWTSFSSGLPGTTIRNLTVDSAYFLHASTIGQGVYRTYHIVPVAFRSFTARYSESGILLTWETTSEENNAGFAVERRDAGEDREWREIGFVHAAGNARDGARYSYIDDCVEMFQGTRLEYRLKQIDMDGSAHYSEALEIEITGFQPILSMAIYPNPVASVEGNARTVTIRYSLASPQRVLMEMCDLSGRKTATLVDTENDRGTYTVQWTPTNIADGIYFCRLTTKTGVLIRKVILAAE